LIDHASDALVADDAELELDLAREPGCLIARLS